MVPENIMGRLGYSITVAGTEITAASMENIEVIIGMNHSNCGYDYEN